MSSAVPPKLPRPELWDEDTEAFVEAPTYRVGVPSSMGFLEVDIGPPQVEKPDDPAIKVEGRWRQVVAAVDSSGVDRVSDLFPHRVDVLDAIEHARPEDSWDGFECLAGSGGFIVESKSLGGQISVNLPPPAIDWVVEGLVPNGAVTVLVGQPKAGKTRIAAAVGLAVANGHSLFGCYAVRRGRVLSYFLEDPELARNRILRLSCAGLGLSQSRIEALPVRLVEPSTALRLDRPLWKTDDDESFDSEAGEMLMADIRRFEPALVIIDSLRRVHRRDESSSTDMAPVMEALRHIAQRTAVLVIHHPGQARAGDERRAPGELLRGTTDFRALARSIIAVHRRKDGELLLAVEGNYVDGIQGCRVRVQEDAQVLKYEVIEDAGEDDNLVLGVIRARPVSGADLETLVHGIGATRIRAAVKRLAAAKRIVRGTENRKRRNGRPQPVQVWAVNPRSLVSHPDEGSAFNLRPVDQTNVAPHFDDEEAEEPVS